MIDNVNDKLYDKIDSKSLFTYISVYGGAREEE